MSQEAILGIRGVTGAPEGQTPAEVRDEVAHLYHLRRQYVFQAVVAYTHDPAIAEDVTQETFFRLYRHLVAGGTVDNVLAWTVTVARNLAIDHLREQQHEKPASEEFWQTHVETCADTDVSPEDLFANREAVDRILVLIELLPEQQRNCVSLYGRGLSFKEIAESLTLPYHQALLLTRDGLNRVKRLMMRTSPKP